MNTPSKLTQADLEMFARLGIDAELVARAGIFRVSDQEARTFGFQFSPASKLDGLVFPHYDPLTGNRVASRLRRDHPEVGPGGKPKNKYIFSRGDNPHLYFPPGSASLLSDTTVPVVFVEAEKSSLAVIAMMGRVGRKFLAAATGGCWSWIGKVGIKTSVCGEREMERGPLSDLSLISWEQGRLALIVFDSNVASNPHVRSARWAFAQALVGLGATVQFVNVPGEGRVNGPDDLIGAAGDEAMLKLIDTAKPFPEQAEHDAQAAITALSKSSDLGARDQVIDAIACVAELPHQRVLIERAAKALGERSKKAVELEIGLRARALREAREEAKEVVRQGRLLRIRVEPAVVVEELVQFFGRRMYLRSGAPLILALYVLNTWCFDLFETVPYLLLTSPVPQCGKTRLLGLLESVCARARAWVSVSGASMFRTIELHRPTLLIDQVEKLATVDESARDLIAILDAGYKKGARVPRMTGKNHDIILEFSVYCPKVLACVGKLKGGLLDRCIVNDLDRKPSGLKLESARTKAIAGTAKALRDACEAYAVQQRENLIRLYEEEPNEGYWPALADREQELFGPLLFHARVAGIEQEALKVARAFSGRKLDIQSQEKDFSLARELCDVLEVFKDERFSSKGILYQLQKRESWGSRLASAKNEHSASTLIGSFLGRFRLDSRRHEDSGTTYERAEAITKISAYILRDSGVSSLRDSGTSSESGGCMAETSQERVVHGQKGVSPQSIDGKAVESSLAPLIPEIDRGTGEEESEPELTKVQRIEAEQVACREVPAARDNGRRYRGSHASETEVTAGVLKF
jgi:hypothetical protein